MTRDILLPSSGNIFMDSFQWKLIKNKIYDHFDKIYILINTPFLNQELYMDYKNLYDDHKCILLNPYDHYIGHIKAMEILSKFSKSDSSCFFESDYFIYDYTVFDNAFKKIESNDVDYIGEPRGFCTPESIDAFREKYCDMCHIYEDGSVWKFPNTNKWPGNQIYFAVWPCGFYAKNEIITNESYYRYTNLKKGEIIPELDNYVCLEDNVYDTFTYSGLKFFKNKLKFDIQYLTLLNTECDVQYHSFLNFLNEDYIKKAKYRSIHIQNSSTQLNSCGLNEMEYNINDIIHIDNPNFIKNVVIFDSFLNMYDKKSSEFYKYIKYKWEKYLNVLKDGYTHNHELLDMNGKKYIFEYDKIFYLSNLHQNSFNEHLG